MAGNFTDIVSGAPAVPATFNAPMQEISTALDTKYEELNGLLMDKVSRVAPTFVDQSGNTVVTIGGEGTTLRALDKGGAVFHAEAYRAGGVITDTGAIQAAMDAAAAVSGTVDLGARNWQIRNVSVLGTSAAPKSLRIVGHGNVLTRDAVYAAEESDLITAKWCDLEVVGVVFDHARPAGMTSSTRACLYVYKASSVALSGCTFLHGQYHGVVCNACDNVRASNCHFEECYYDGFAVGGGLEGIDGADLPYGSNRIVLSNCTFKDCWGAVIVQVYCYEVILSQLAITGGSIQIGQAINRLLINGIALEGSSTYGFGAQAGAPAADGIFAEDPLDFVIDNYVIRNVQGKGIYLTGSELSTTPAGPQQGPIPLQRGIVGKGVIYQPTAEGILITGRATNQNFVGSPTPDGEYVTVKGALVIGGSVGISLNTTQHATLKDVEVHGSNTHGILIAGCTYTHLDGFTVVDPSGASVGTYDGIRIEQGSLHTTIGNGVIRDTRGAGNQMAAGVRDSVLEGSVASMTRYSPNLVVLGNRSPKLYPVPGVPALGTWETGDFIPLLERSEAGTTGSKYVVLGYDCVAGGTPGTWVARRALTGN